MKKVNIVFLSKSEFGNNIPKFHNLSIPNIPSSGDIIIFNRNMIIDENDEVLNSVTFTVSSVEYFLEAKTKCIINIFVK
ncbi:MAG: hypothetical protein IPQ23_22095 [Cytophagaceae bacterium]|nr:hypothetical protein [Cytophagaceae bacterium]